jgi:hypothetical protein
VPSPTTAKSLRNGFAARSVHAKPWFDCLLPVQALSGGVSLRSPFALDSLELAARYYDAKAACLGQSMAEAERPLTASNGHIKIADDLW